VLLWSAQFKSGYAEWFRAAERVNFLGVAWVLAMAGIVGAGLVGFLPGHGRRERGAAGACVAATGFTMMGFQIFLLLGFQAVYGYVYTELAILIGLFMAGMALGSWIAIRANHSGDGCAVSGWSLAWVQAAVAIACPAMLWAMSAMEGASSGWAAWVAANAIFPALAAIGGALGGFQFVIAAGIFLRGEREGLGVLYAIDLLGGCVGALVLSTYLIPVYGFWRTAWLGAEINAAGAIMAVLVSLRRPHAARVEA